MSESIPLQDYTRSSWTTNFTTATPSTRLYFLFVFGLTSLTSSD